MGTAIEWTDETWNPVTGCTKVSPGCDHCYAERVTERFAGKGSFERVVLHPDRLNKPLRWRKPRKVFVNSMSDLFHEQVPDEFLARTFAIMAAAPEHTFQVLTKRHARMRAWLSGPAEQQVRDVLAGWERFGLWMDSEHRAAWLCPDGLSGRVSWPLPNVWLGVSVEDQKWADIRIPALLDTPAAVRFLSCEPLLGPITLPQSMRWPLVDWVIVGGESGPGARPMHPGWAHSLRVQSEQMAAAFLFKQWGEWAPDPVAAPISVVDTEGHEYRYRMRRAGKKAAGRELDGRTWDQYPATRTPAMT